MLFQGFSKEFLKSIIAESLKTSPPGSWNITRHYMYSKLRGILKAYDGDGKRCLSISHSAFLARLLGLENAQLMEANYPEHSMLNLDFQDDTFDYCVSDQVLEHIEGNPFAAFRESLRVTRPGGFIVHTTCFMNEIHNMPKDYWRFTPDALRLIAEDCQAVVLECGGWGNKDVWRFMELGFRAVPVPRDPSHPICRMAMKNEDTIPIVTWVIAQKQSDPEHKPVENRG
jgi:SAM-dependent methyltransferase